MAASGPAQWSTLYGFVRSRQLEGTYPGDRATGYWGTTGMRVRCGWGAVSEEEWPYSAVLRQWPPAEPPGLDEKAKVNRISRYQRIHNSFECKYAIPSHLAVQASFEITAQWFNAEKGIIEMPVEGAEIIGSHAVSLIGYSDDEEVFMFANSWGQEWGDAGFGKLSYEYFDRWMLDVYVLDQRQLKLTSTAPASIEEIRWGVHDFAERPFHVHEVHDRRSDERLAWAFAMPGEGFLDVQELFVRPQYRHRGYGTRLLKSLHRWSNSAHLSLRLFVPFADCGADNLRAVETLLEKEGYFLTASGVRWAPYTAVRKRESVRIPPPPGLVRAGCDALAAPISPFSETIAAKMTQPMDAAGTDPTNYESQLRRLIPPGNPPGNKSNVLWVIVLSDWSQRPPRELIDQIEGILRQHDERALLPTVLIVDDLGGPESDHEVLLSDLTRAGGIVLASDSQEEIDASRRDPLAFAATQLLAAQSHLVGTIAPSPPVPSSPDGYKEFAKAVTRLTPGSLQELIEGHRTDDWRYST